MAYKIFIDGKEGTTGLKIYERFANRGDIEILTIDDEKRKDPVEKAKMINASDFTFLCLPDAASIESVALCTNPKTRIIDASTAHRTNPAWAYGFPELDKSFREKIISSNRVAVPGCYASGFNAIAYPLVKSGIPVMSHLGLTPQFYNAFGGHKRQGKTEDSVEKIKREAKMAEELGCFSVVLECIPQELAEEITQSILIPTIGIGCGNDCDGQVLVLQDLLGMSDFTPKFVKKYLDGRNLITVALNEYVRDVKNGVSNESN